MIFNGFLSKLQRDSRGAVVIETAIVAPVLVMLALGAFETSRIVSRQMEIQSAVAEAAQIAIAAKPDTSAERTTLKNIIRASASLDDAEVTITNVYRCGSTATTVTTAASCAGSDVITTYLNIAVTDIYTPLWTTFGIGSPFNYNISRRVIVA
jgi:Flp pilus assembly protein TadG